MLATILNGDKAFMTTISIIETFAVARRNMSLKNFGDMMFVFFLELNFVSPKFGIRSNNQKIINASPKFGFAPLREPQRPA